MPQEQEVGFLDFLLRLTFDLGNCPSLGPGEGQSAEVGRCGVGSRPLRLPTPWWRGSVPVAPLHAAREPPKEQEVNGIDFLLLPASDLTRGNGAGKRPPTDGDAGTDSGVPVAPEPVGLRRAE
ncbi:hypothetical protein VR45_09395 [Streptomyces sp. NRRL S-495]|nr:hypothetical protein VR45_09395 [Streptomyces sp. NRRL S-495]